ncbi:MAG: hypothetical protein K2W96_10355, partial [Gemmataceae bacterium]|nr:hypothetical protein [Gemmataceae bacterium]
PDACPSVDFACLNIDTWKRYRGAKGGIDRLARELAPLLTGVPLDDLDNVGWVVHDQKTGQVVSSFRSQERTAA